MLFKKVAIIGVGLIGGSVGCAIRKRKLATRVVGFGRNKRKLALAKRIGAIDEGTLKLRDAVSDADLIVLATPVSLIAKFTKSSLPFSKPGAVFTDVGSTKCEVVRAMECLASSKVRFVGSHPLAGSRNSGAAYSCSGLFENSVCILTKTNRTDAKAFSLVKRLWDALGARTIALSPADHDVVVAQISHLPHLAASALTLTPNAKALKLAASGFRDTTRIASGDPLMWRDICLSNKSGIMRAIDKFTTELNALKAMVARKDSKGLLRKFERAKKVRDSINEK